MRFKDWQGAIIGALYFGICMGVGFLLHYLTPEEYINDVLVGLAIVLVLGIGALWGNWAFRGR